MPQIEKAETLRGMLRAFQTEPLNESEFSKFYYDNTMPIRTGNPDASPLEDLFEECTTPLAKNAHLLMGHGGCGKSTELFQLKQRLERAGQPAYIIDFMAETDFQNANQWDIMLLITEGLCQIVERYGLRVPNRTLQAVLDYIKKKVVIETVSGTSAGFELEGGVEASTPGFLKGFLKAFASFKSEVKANASSRATITETMDKRASEWIAHIKEISDRIMTSLPGKQPVLIIENIDKIQPPEKALDILRYTYLSDMPFPIIYTFPISLYYDHRFAWIENNYKPHTLPMIKVANADKSDHQGGIEAIREIVKLRADGALFAEDALTHLIKQTGGVLRDLFRCIISAARLANRREAMRIEERDANRALSDLRDELSRRVTMDDNDKLVNIYKDPKFREQIEDLRFLLEKMQALVVLEYRNGERWHNLHPMVAEFLKKQGVIENDDGR